MKIFNNIPHAMEQRVPEIEWVVDQIKSECNLNLEFGVHKGHTLNVAAKRRPDLTFFGFDSFEGLERDMMFGHKYIKADIFKLNNLPKVEPNVQLIEGWFNDTLETFLNTYPQNISYLNIDCDTWEAAYYVLEKCNDRITTDTILRCDEYKCWRTVNNEPDDGRIPRGRFGNWKKDGEYPAVMAWLEEFKREIEIVGRNWQTSAIFKVIK